METDGLFRSKSAPEDQRRSMNRYHAIAEEVLMAYCRKQVYYRPAYRMSQIRLSSSTFTIERDYYHFCESLISRGLAVMTLPMDPTEPVGFLGATPHDEQAHLMRVHQHLA